MTSTDKLLAHPQALCNIVRRIAVGAGQATLEYFDEAGFAGHTAKADGSPVTVADQVAENIIVAALRELTPEIPIVAEELTAAGNAPVITPGGDCWLVDPLDGTLEFVAGRPDYTVNIALVRDGRPALGVIYAPVHGELYAACGPGTAIRWNEAMDKEKSIRGRAVPAAGYHVISSRGLDDDRLMNKFLENYKIAKLTRRGSSLKLCLLADGHADMYPRFGTTYEWDTAAGEAILLAAGGSLVDLEGGRLQYGQSALGFKNSNFVASGAALVLPSQVG